MSDIFISYRRQDTAGHAGRLFDHLRNRFGKDHVFMDVTKIGAGSDFAAAIEEAVSTCDVLLAMIGKDWLDCRDAAGRRRLDDPNDFIRLEVAAALRRNVKVIPVLVEDARLPDTASLPDDLKPLMRRQAVELRDERWDADVHHLLDELDKILGSKRRGRLTSALPWGGWALALFTVVVGLVINHQKIEAELGKREVPSVVGLPLEDATKAILEAGLERGAIHPEPNDAVPPQQVTSQSVEAGTRIRRQGKIDLVYAVPVQKTMPSVVGLTLDAATAALAARGLKVGTVTRREAESAVEQQVLEQLPPAGSPLTVQGQRPVDLVVAVAPATSREGGGTTQPATTPVPRLIGLSLEAARDKLRDGGFELRVVARETSDGDPDRVLRQSPAPGNPIASGQTVEVVVAAPPAAETRISVPDVTGLSVDDAMDKLRAAGLSPQSRASEPRPDQPANVVRGQRPAAGQKVAPRAQVTVIFNPATTITSATTITVPEVTSLSLDAARAAIEKAGLVVGRIDRLPQGSAAPGTVVAQSPRAGTRDVARGSPVTLAVAVQERARDTSALHSQGTLVVRLGSGLDLDEGKVRGGEADDLSYKPIGGAGPFASGTQIAPANRAGVAFLSSPTRESCAAASTGFSSKPTDELIRQSLCVHTNGGRIAVVRVNGYVGGSQENLELHYLTWDKP